MARKNISNDQIEEEGVLVEDSKKNVDATKHFNRLELVDIGNLMDWVEDMEIRFMSVKKLELSPEEKAFVAYSKLGDRIRPHVRQIFK